MNRYRFYVAFLLLLLPGLMQAQQKWELKDCIEYGLKNHGSTRIAENDIRNAAAQRKEALSTYLPGISGNGNITNNLKPQETVIPAGIFSPTDIKVAFTKKYNTNGYVDLNQPIYDQAAITSIKAAKFNTEEAILSRQQTDENLIYNISNAYYQVFVYRIQLALLEFNRNTYAEQVRIAQLGVNKGVTAEVDLNKIQVNLNNTNSNINVAQSNLELSEAQLKNAMGYPQEQPLPMDTALTVTNNSSQLMQAIGDSTFNANNFTDVKLSKTDLALLDIDAKRIRAGALPSLSFAARYGAIGFGDHVGESFSSISTYGTVSLNLKIPLFDGFRRNAQYTQAKIKQQNAEESLRLDTARYRVDYENAKTKLLKAQINVVNDQRNIDLAQSVFNSTNLQYEKGVTDLTNWLNAQASLREAQNNYLSSLYSFYTARLDLEKAAGTLKNFYSSL
jgi:outer membrane protein TolC